MSYYDWIKQNKSRVENEARIIASMHITQEDILRLSNNLVRLERDLATQKEIQERNKKELGSIYVNKLSLAKVVNIKLEIKETESKIKHLTN